VVESSVADVSFDYDLVFALFMLLDRLNVRLMNLSLRSSLCISKSNNDPSGDSRVELLAFGLDILQIK
jgi:hypothetical protein